MRGQTLPQLPPAVDRRQVLVDGLISLIQAETWTKSQRMLEAHPEYLDTETDALLEQLAAAQQNDDKRQLIKEHRVLLTRCREIGIASAFAELRGQHEQSATNDFAAQLNLLCQQVVGALQNDDATQRDTLATRLDDMIREPMPLEGAQDFLMLLAAWLRGEDITSRVETLQPPFQSAYHQMVVILSQQEQAASDPQEILLQNLISFIEAETWTDSEHSLAAHPEFLSTEADALLEQLAAAQQDEGARTLIENKRNLLRRCRSWGIEPALYFTFGMRLGDSIEIPQEHEAALQHIATLLSQHRADETALDHAIEAMHRLLDSLSTEVPSLFEAALLRDLADAMQRLPAGHPARDLEQMEGFYRKALLAYQAADRPFSVLFVQRALASVLTGQGRYEEALEPLQATITGLQEYEEYKEEVVWALSEYASDLDSLGRTEEALASYTKVIAMLPDASPLYRNRAETLIHARRLDEVEADLEHTVQLDGNEDNPYLWYRRAQLAIARGDSLQAQHMLDELKKRDDSFDIGWLPAQIAWLQGDLQTARETLQNVWEKANSGERSAICRDMVRLFDEHAELTGRDVLESIMH